jgi:uncharacterized protein with HEPN domain
MPRDCRIYLEDILDAVHKVRSYTAGLSKAAFIQDDKTFDAVVRNLEIIGEAAKSVPTLFAPMRRAWNGKRSRGSEILIHEYFGIDGEIVWDIVQHKLPSLETAVQRLLSDLG